LKSRLFPGGWLGKILVAVKSGADVATLTVDDVERNYWTPSR
jgi:hypothetical protein